MSIESTLKALHRELRDLERKRAKLVGAIQALEMLDGALTTNGNGSAPAKRRAGGSVLIDAAVEALRAAAKPLRIVELIAAIQKRGVQADRPANKVRGTLVSAMLRRGDLFTKPPGTRGVYGLAMWADSDTK